LVPVTLKQPNTWEKMNRSCTNIIRFFIDECIPPIIRDSKWFMFPFFWFAYRGKLVKQAMQFKSRVVTMTLGQYADFYETIDSISRTRETDLNAQCLEAILSAVPGGPVKILDAGCGQGFLLRAIGARYPKADLYGLDLKTPAEPIPGSFFRGSVDAMPFRGKAFDIVICTHTLEHCMHLERVVQELKRVSGCQLIVVVPKQRPFYYTVDEHLQFFFYRELLTTAIGIPNPECRNLGGDWFYRGRL
jgi:ubiquinone/menaquinone biosynthesis C-methylase UbiE